MNKTILLSRMNRSIFFKIGICGIIFIFIACYIFPLFLDWDPYATSISDRFLAPEGFEHGLKGHILGTDAVGRDMLIRLLIGGQYSFRLAFVVVALQMAIGTVLGILAGYIGGWVDVLVMRACDALMAMPTLIISIAVIAILGQSMANLIFVMTLSGWVQNCKVTRNNVLVIKNQEFVSASRVIGAKLPHIMFSEIFPNVTTNIIILASQRIGMTIIIEASLSYLNLGIKPPAPSWGNMISLGRNYLVTQPWMILVPGFTLMIAVLSFNFLGDGIRDILDTKRRI
jgi:peptide/nickel transport system permease protein